MTPRIHTAAIVFSAALVITALAGCTEKSPQETGSAKSDREPPALENPIRDLETVEDLTETAANRLIEFSYVLRRRDFTEAAKFLTTDFAAGGFSEISLDPAVDEEIANEVRRFDRKLEPQGLVTQSGAEFLGTLESLLDDFESVDYVFLKTRGAEFEADAVRGLVRLTFNVIGRVAGGAPRSLYCWAHGEVRRDAADAKSEWQLHRIALDRYRVLRRAQPLFTDVASVAGIARQLPQLKDQKDPSFYWQGAATADIDGDGRFDIFVSGTERCFLFRNVGDGKFEDVAETAGTATPGSVTGPLFLDYDNDGDQDLFLGSVGWIHDGIPYGKPLRLLRNDGSGRFEDVSLESGIDAHAVAFSAVAADVDDDGWLDIFICGYNRLDAVYPNHWFAATNGTPNKLYRNLGDGTFEDVAVEAGVAGSAWSYAAAFADFDEDGDQDLYVANDYGDNNLFRNDGKGKFTDVAADLGVLDNGNGMGAAWGDLSGDGRLDLYVSNMSSSAGNRILNRILAKESEVGGVLYKGAAGNTIFTQEDGGFRMVPPSAGGIGASWAWGVCLEDIDLDGVLDIYVANGFISGDSLKDT